MYGNGESIFYYLTVMNEAYEMPAMPEGVARRHPEGAVQVQADRQAEGEAARAAPRQRRDPARGVKAQAILEEKYNVGADVWSVTSYSSSIVTGTPPSAGTCCTRLKPPKSAVRHASAGRRAWRLRGGVRLPEGAAGRDRPLAAAPSRLAGHRRLRPQRKPRRPAQPLRGRFALRRRRRRCRRWRARSRSTRKVVQKAITDLGINAEKANPASA